MKHLLFVILSIGCFFGVVAASRVSQLTRDKLADELPTLGLSLGDSVFIRTFKQESLLELWIRGKGQTTFRLFRTYPICYYSGELGPKRYRGDKMTPEGFYAITSKQLNPYSRFHLSMNIGYPNAYDRQLQRTGSLIMIHGACDAIGCFAMSNSQIEEIYYLVEQALIAGQNQVAVHAFPFRLEKENLINYQSHKWYGFWKQLQVGYQLFNRDKIPPIIDVIGGRYVFSSAP